jgi:GT2 family glycosyltransferase
VELLATCIDSLQARTDYPNVEVIVIDNGSVEPATLDFLQHLRGMPGYTVIRDDGPFNFSRLNNLAAAQAQGEVLVMMNNDIEAIEPQWLDALVAQAMRPEIGAVGALLLYPDDTIQHGGVVLGIGGVAGHVHHRLPADAHGYFGRARLAQRFSAVTAACLAVRRSCWDAVEGLDEGLAVAFNDIDFCLRLQRAGYRNLWTPLARLYHHESASRGSDEVPEKRERFNREIAYMQNRWGDSLLADPCYNPNLSLNSQRFELAYPPRLRGATQARVEAA